MQKTSRVMKIIKESGPHLVIAVILAIWQPDQTGWILFWAILYPDILVLIYQVWHKLDFFRIEGIVIFLHISLLFISLVLWQIGEPVLALAAISHFIIDIIEICIDPGRGIKRYVVFKKWFDALFSAIAIVILSPLLLAIALSIKLDSKGPIFYHQRRMTIHGRAFNILKFRTMVANARNKQLKDNIAKEKLITRIGKIWRELHFDELAQLFHVFVGPMSFIGPRPLLYSNEIKRLHHIPHWDERLKVRGGITGLTRLVNILPAARRDKLMRGLKRDPEINLKKERNQCAFDRYYVRNISIGLDWRITWSTVGLLWRRLWGVAAHRRFDEFTDMKKKPYLTEYRH